MNATNLYALIVMYLIAALGTLGSIMYQFNPVKATARFKINFGIDFDKLNSQPSDLPPFKRFFSYFGSLLLGANYITFFTAWLAFHDHNQIAWCSISYYPIMFLWHFIITLKKDKTKYLQLFFLALSLSALILTMPDFN